MMLLSQNEIIQFAVPFVFVFAIIFGIMQTITFGSGKQFPVNATAIIAAVFGFATTIYEPTRILIFNILPFATIILLVVFFFVFVSKVLGHDDVPGVKKNTGTTLAVLGISLLLLGSIWNPFTSYLGISYSFSNDMLWILGIVFVLLIIYAGTRGGD